MGCDGGTIPRRDELVRVKKKPETKDKDAELAFKWRCCSITQETLQQPIVVCHLGKLYNKVSLIEALLDRGALSESFKHVKSLKDVRELKLTENPEAGKNDSSAAYICPVLGLEMTGKFRFVALWSCGCAFSERALKEIGTKTCHKCSAPFVEDDVIVINGTEEDMPLMKERMEKRKQANKKKTKTVIKVEESDVSSSCASSSKVEEAGRKRKANDVSHSKIANVISVGKVTKQEELKKMKADYSVAKDKQATDVYKSLFTSHKSEKEQNRAHWVTYNPFYN
ncbi:unnamed protein product [Phyllotreta striolata]|uniref:Replication termination factor 2 n=1 Tax=Phyllotreta striolata TaxID=444603 RepID=A0A9N9XN46_PHYSR|nr:unnamed protein product [Phyllotreta striolata]